jgi:hypothetical protein
MSLGLKQLFMFVDPMQRLEPKKNGRMNWIWMENQKPKINSKIKNFQNPKPKKIKKI